MRIFEPTQYAHFDTRSTRFPSAFATKSTSNLGLRLALRHLGINPESDTKIITAGGNPERLVALSRGLIQFTIMPEPWVREAEKLGFHDLLDTGSLALPFHWNAVLTRESIIKTKRSLLARVVRATTDAIHFIKTAKRARRRSSESFSSSTTPRDWNERRKPMR
jgi:ABC-type nitrate/sulfonate/bicarbonate transport system substrate-binding protein